MNSWLQLDSNPPPLCSQTNTQPFSHTCQMIELCCEYLPAWCIWLYQICQVTRICPVAPTFLDFHPHSGFSLAFMCILHKWPTFCLMEAKLARQILLQEQKRNIGHRSICISSNWLLWVMKFKSIFYHPAIWYSNSIVIISALYK